MVCRRSGYICNVCNGVCAYEFRYNQNCRFIEISLPNDKLDVFEYIFCNKNDMRDNMGNNEYVNQRQVYGDNAFLLLIIRHYLHSVISVLKEDFKTGSIAMKITDIFGSISIVYSMLDALFDKSIFDGMPLGFRYSLWFFACCYSVILLIRGYEKLMRERQERRKLTLENDIKLYEFNQMKNELLSLPNKK